MQENRAPVFRSIDLLGVRIDDVTLPEAVAHAAACIARGGAHQFATVNPEFVMIARRDPVFAAALANSALNTPDGIGILKAAARLKRPLRARVTGVDLAEQLCARAAQTGWRVYLLGAADGVAECAAAIWQQRYPGLTIAGAFAGSPRSAEDDALCERIRATQPNLLLVAYGAPAQDVWLARNMAKLARDDGGLVGIGVGGVFDYVTGVRPLAPRWMRAAGLEWFFRLVMQPSRWRRQLDLLRFVAAVRASR